jgi:hypothetical protein
MPAARFFKIILVLLVSGFVTGCISSQQIMTEKAPALFREVALSASRQSDVVLVRQGILPSHAHRRDAPELLENRDLSLPGPRPTLLLRFHAEEDEQGPGRVLERKSQAACPESS